MNELTVSFFDPAGDGRSDITGSFWPNLNHISVYLEHFQNLFPFLNDEQMCDEVSETIHHEYIHYSIRKEFLNNTYLKSKNGEEKVIKCMIGERILYTPENIVKHREPEKYKMKKSLWDRFWGNLD